jgi:hypothetical protein
VSRLAQGHGGECQRCVTFITQPGGSDRSVRCRGAKDESSRCCMLTPSCRAAPRTGPESYSRTTPCRRVEYCGTSTSTIFLHVELERSVRYDNRMRCSDGSQQMSGASTARKAAPTDCGRCSVLRSESACTRTRRAPQRFPPTSRRPDQEK